MSPCDIKNLIRWAVAALLAGLLVTAGALWYSDRLTHETTQAAHKVVLENQQEIHFLEAQLDAMRSELKVCIEGKARR